MANYPYKKVGVQLDKIRNDVNENFVAVENDFKEAKVTNDNLQTQVNTLVVSGDSSPQAQQASVGADGTNYNGNLKARLDSEYNNVTAQLAEIANNINERGVNLRSFILFIPNNDTLPESQWDWTEAFNQAKIKGKVIIPSSSNPYNVSNLILNEVVLIGIGAVTIKPTGLITLNSDTGIHGITFDFVNSVQNVYLNGSKIVFNRNKVLNVNATKHCVQTLSCDDIKITNNDLSGGHHGVYVEKSNNTFIHKNYIHNTGDTGIEIRTDQGTQSKNHRIAYNCLENCGLHGIQWWGGDSAVYANTITVDDVKIIGNRLVTMAQAGIWGSLGKNIVVAYNHIENLPLEAIDFEGCQNCTAIGNTLYNAGMDNGAFAVFFHSEDILFSDNTVIFDNIQTFYNLRTNQTSSHVKTSVKFIQLNTNNKRITFKGNKFTIKNSIGVGEVSIFDFGDIKASENVVFESNDFYNGLIKSYQLNKHTIKNNRFLNTFDGVNTIQLELAEDININDNQISFDGSNTETDHKISPIYVGQFANVDKTKNIFIERNTIEGYQNLGISVDGNTTLAQANNASFVIQNNLVNAIHHNYWSSQFLIQNNYKVTDFTNTPITLV